ncbi:MAG TPA: RraA family protein [Bryobacteraceae bacterium]|nr:RraA family protein [Bryobacteraceae bacterium]
MITKLTEPSVDLEKLRALDTCTVSNAIESFNVRLRNEGFVAGAVRCRFPKFGPMVGYAVTGRIRSSSPPMSGCCYYDRMDFWNYVVTLPRPRVLVLQDIDHVPGFGAFVGEIHATIGMALGCIGYVTNGSVRDLSAVRALGFHMFSGSVAVSHAYAHLVEFGDPVEIGGLKISPGDLMHGDRHGVQTIPLEIAGEVAGQAVALKEQEKELIAFCRSQEFSLQGLADRLARVSKDCL